MKTTSGARAASAASSSRSAPNARRRTLCGSPVGRVLRRRAMPGHAPEHREEPRERPTSRGQRDVGLVAVEVARGSG